MSPTEELESTDESESPEEVLRELNNLTKYKLNKTGLENIHEKGLAMLGANLQAERQSKIKRVKREGDQIDAAVNHYHKNQIFRRKKRDALLDTTQYKPKMNWENKWDKRRLD